jgi:catechol 2,3-dioxygenase-like lactoylglutathione lyase family enzyme
MQLQTLRESLRDWMDFDGAGCALGVCLGLIPAREGWGRHKHVFWSNNPIGEMLYKMLDELVSAGVLEQRDEPDFQYRWNKAFRGSWEWDSDSSIAFESAQPPAAQTLNLIVLRVADIEHAMSFYRLLGLIFAKHTHGSGPEHYIAGLQDTWLELYPATPDQPVSSSTRIGFQVNDVDGLVAQLSAVEGAKVVVAAKESEWGHRAVVADPDGHRVELTNPYRVTK